MRRLLTVALALACAHAPRPLEPSAWRELQTEHFVLRTDLPAEDARRVATDLEEVRAALLAVGWHSSKVRPGRTQVIALADERELEEYALKGIEGFVASDSFGDPIMVVNGGKDPDEQRFLKHELTHVITNELLVRNPRWVSEGISCYLETLRFDRKQGKVVIGEVSRDRMQFLADQPVQSFWSVMQVGREAEQMSAREAWQFETSAWALVHWLVDQRPTAFDDMLARLAKGEDQYYAFSAAFPDLNEATMKAGVGSWLKGRKAQVYLGDAPSWRGAVVERALPRAEVYALLADLLRLSPGYRQSPERVTRKQSLLALALEVDPGHPLALRLSDGMDAAVATRAHPDDWRSWLLFADRNNHDLAASQKAAKLAPDNPTVLSQLAIAEQAAGQTADALLHAARSVEMSPGRSDLLATYAIVLADSGRCAEGQSYVQRSIDLLPDAAPSVALSALKSTRKSIGEHCLKLAVIKERKLGPPKSCDPAPRFGRKEAIDGALVAEFVVGEDGSVSDLTVKGKASERVLAALKRYVQSCKYDPVRQDGKALEIRWKVEFDVHK